MLSLLIISNNPKAKLIQDSIQPLVETEICLVADFEDGLNEVFDKSPATVIIQEQIAGVTCDAIARYIKQMLGTDAPNFIMIHEGNAKVSHVKGLFGVFVDLNQPDETLVAEVSSVLKRIIDGEQPTAADVPQPLQSADVPVETDTAASETEEITSIPLEPAIQKFRVLLVEDNIIGQRVALTMLSNLGCEVDIVPDGQKAIHALELINYDMVLMDWMMPRMDGLEATIKIRDTQSKVLNHDVPIIALTSNTKPGDREKCLEAGMTDYLAKPVKKAYLAEVIEKWVRKPELDGSADTDPVEESSPLIPEAQGAETVISPDDDKTAETETAERAESAKRSSKKKTAKATKAETSTTSDQIADSIEPDTAQNAETVDESITSSEEGDLEARPPHILLVEDNIIGQRVALTMLNNLGCKVDIVPDGLKAVSALQSINYDMVLMDWNMPRMNGLEATVQIRDTQSGVLNHAVPIIALTSNTETGDREKCLEAGMSDYLQKPVKKAYLAEVIEKWLKGTALGGSVDADVSETSSQELDAEMQVDEVAQQSAPASDESSSELINELDNADRIQLEESLRTIETLEQAVAEKILEVETVKELLQAERDERSVAGQSLNESERKYRSIIQVSIDGFWLVDDAGQLLEVNNAYCRMSGYSELELCAMNVSDLEVSDITADITNYLHEMITDDDEFFETRHRCKDGSILDVEIHARYQTGEDGRVMAFVRDISGRMDAEDALNQAKIEADAAEERLQAAYAARTDAEEMLSMVRMSAEAASREAEAVVKQMQAERDDWQHLEMNLEQVIADRTRELATANEQVRVERAEHTETEEALHQSILAAEALNKQVEVINEYLQTERFERQQVENRLKEEQELLAKVVADMQSMPAETVNESIAARVTSHTKTFGSAQQRKPAAPGVSTSRSRLLIYLLTAVVVLSALAGGWYLFTMKPKSPLLWDRTKKPAPTAPAKPAAKTPETVKPSAKPVSVPTPPLTPATKPATTGAAKPDLTVPSFVTVSGRDSKFSAGNPGWERYVDAKHDIRIYREAGRLKAVQVLAAKGHVIVDTFMRSALQEVSGNSDYKSVSSETKDGFVIERNSVGPKSKLIVYRELPAKKISAFVVQFE